MPAATNKADLLTVTDTEFTKLRKLIQDIPADTAMIKDDADTSIKDVIAHRAHWIDLFLGWYRDGQADQDVALPAPGYKWSDLKRYNADLRAEQRDLDWQTACSLLSANHAKLTGFLSGLSDETLYAAPMKGGKSKWSTGRWAEAAGPSHYRSAAKFIRARLRAQPSKT